MKTTKAEKITEGEPVVEDTSSSKYDYKEWRGHHHTGGNGVLAIILVALGAVFLLRNFDLLPPETLQNIWKLWPLALIIWGIQLLFGRTWFANVLVMLVTLVIVYLLLSYFNPSLNLDVNNFFQNIHLR
jgi:hypothetical protein